MSNPKYNTMVFKGKPDGNFFTTPYLGMECIAWSRGQALDEKEQLENFIRDLSYGEIEFPEDEAALLMQRMGWN